MSRPMRGHLKIFFSYGPGTGKTYAMLQAAHAAAAAGVDVVIGCLAEHTPEETMALTEDLEWLDDGAGHKRDRFDLDRALKRRPGLILVDDLAHTNGQDSRHHKRYKEVEELLNGGIDVYSTVDVSSIEGLHDTVASITGTVEQDRIPDSVFDCADQVELIDVEPMDLMRRIPGLSSQSEEITVARLTALREIALRRCADRVKYLSDSLKTDRYYHTKEHILVCLSAAPTNAKIIRTASRMARAFNSQFTALFVETPDFAAETPENKKRLQENQHLARQLGANIETVYGEDIPYQIAEFARLSEITKIVLGNSAAKPHHILRKPTLTEQLILYAPDIDIHIIPDSNLDHSYRPQRLKYYRGITVLKNVINSAAILSGATALCLLFYKLGFTNANIIMVYILGVQLISVATSHQIYSLISSVASVFIFNYLFTTPRFSLTAYETGYPVTFVVMFLTAFMTGTFAIRYKEQARQSAVIAYRTKILFDTDQLLSKAGGKDEILDAAGKQIAKLLKRGIVIFEAKRGQLSPPRLFGINKEVFSDAQMEKELATVEWVMKNNHSAGATTDTLSDSRYLYLAIRVKDRVYGVLGIEAENDPLDASEHGILLSILGECALALENESNAREKEAAVILAESEQLRANLLRTISHDLRTPLTSISGNASNLLGNGDSFDKETRHQIYSDIYEDSMWLINLVENLLSATRIEEGRMTLRTSTELLSELLDEAIHHIIRKASDHKLIKNYSEELLLVKADARLVVQVVANILDNAIKYSGSGSSIGITAEKSGDFARILISDNGPGIPDEEKDRIFDKFYCGANKIADNRRSLGLGLYLCRSIVEAHGGTIGVSDNQPEGAVFHFTLPLEEVTLHE